MGRDLCFGLHQKLNIVQKKAVKEYKKMQEKILKKSSHIDLIEGNIVAGLVRFAIPLMIGNLLQQFYNIADTLIVGRFLGKEALAAVGSAYSILRYSGFMYGKQCFSFHSIRKERQGIIFQREFYVFHFDRWVCSYLECGCISGDGQYPKAPSDSIRCVCIHAILCGHHIWRSYGDLFI